MEFAGPDVRSRWLGIRGFSDLAAGASFAYRLGDSSARKQKMNCKHSVVRVSWIDAENSAGWQEFKDEAPWVIHTIGYLVSSGKKKTDFIVLADSHLPDTDQWGGLNRIPMGMVLGIDTLLESVPCGRKYENSRNPRHSS